MMNKTYHLDTIAQVRSMIEADETPDPYKAKDELWKRLDALERDLGMAAVERLAKSKLNMYMHYHLSDSEYIVLNLDRYNVFTVQAQSYEVPSKGMAQACALQPNGGSYLQVDFTIEPILTFFEHRHDLAIFTLLGAFFMMAHQGRMVSSDRTHIQISSYFMGKQVKYKESAGE